MLLERYRLSNAKERYYNILNHRYDMEISFVILDKSTKIFDNHVNDNNNLLDVIEPKVYRDVSMKSIRKLR
jgi:hypothetical protein